MIVFVKANTDYLMKITLNYLNASKLFASIATFLSKE
jgi:hypothetical protein